MGDSSENNYGRDADLVLIAVFKYVHKQQGGEIYLAAYILLSVLRQTLKVCTFY